MLSRKQDLISSNRRQKLWYFWYAAYLHRIFDALTASFDRNPNKQSNVFESMTIICLVTRSCRNSTHATSGKSTAGRRRRLPVLTKLVLSRGGRRRWCVAWSRIRWLQLAAGSRCLPSHRTTTTSSSSSSLLSIRPHNAANALSWQLSLVYTSNKLRGRATCCGQQIACCLQQVACCPQHVACISAMLLTATSNKQATRLYTLKSVFSCSPSSSTTTTTSSTTNYPLQSNMHL